MIRADMKQCSLVYILGMILYARTEAASIQATLFIHFPVHPKDLKVTTHVRDKTFLFTRFPSETVKYLVFRICCRSALSTLSNVIFNNLKNPEDWFAKQIGSGFEGNMKGFKIQTLLVTGHLVSLSTQKLSKVVHRYATWNTMLV